ncbi:intimin-like inverse autotransporter SinH [Atlantibacter sp.]|uniref:intimin-like inverse autotransporter SinH n=1 Tax=Atlantibacter sp. TaxID=1903473 RepID=UPI0028A93646|nr:intimin-like inverse autotransporter SinH [Atlantibacter sp.]
MNCGNWTVLIIICLWINCAYSQANPASKIISDESAMNSLPELGGGNTEQQSQKSDSQNTSIQKKASDYFVNSATQGFENLTPDALESQARGYVHNQIISSAQSYIESAMSPWGNIRASLAVSDEGDLEGSSLDYFIPWYDNNKSLFFSQFSAMRKEERTIGNAGIGIRQNVGDWLLGGNVFYDYDFSRRHQRLGFGGEAWTNYLKLSGNYYHPLSDWQDSEDFDFYEERPARGWDVRMEGWLPAWPQFGGKLIYERYYGDEVALFGKDNLQKDPHATTVGLTYTPVPLLTLGADYKADGGDNSELSINAAINYRFGTALKDQLNSDNVEAMHSIIASRHDFVERNNFIVLEYREKDPLEVSLWLKADAANEHPECVIKDTPEAAIGLEKCRWTINALIKHHYKIIAASWQSKNNANQTLVMPVIKAHTLAEGNNNRWNLVLPAWHNAPTDAERNALNTWRVRIALEDEKGNRQNSGVVEISIKQNRHIELIADNSTDTDRTDHSHEASVQADGKQGITLALLLTDAFGDTTDNKGNTLKDEVMAPELYDSNDQKVTLRDTPCATESPCVFIAARDKEAGTVTLSSTLPGTFHWKAKTDAYGDSNFIDVSFIGDPLGPVNPLIYQVDESNPLNLIGKKDRLLAMDKRYRFVLWRDKNNDGVFQRAEQLSEEEMASYDYRWVFTGQNAQGHTGAQTHTENQDLIIPATNREAAEKFGAIEQGGIQGYGLRVAYRFKESQGGN